jgi:ubiquinone/menaquinone biosynthesis C-methylase UbiE
MIRRPPRRFNLLLVICFAAIGCARLKQCAYEGLSRDDWQQPEKVIAALAIKPGAVVADLGSGSGYFTFRLAQAAGPSGKVYAVDVDPDMVELVQRKIKEKPQANVETILAKPDHPLLPKAGVDLIFTSNTYHHLENRVAYFSSLRQFLRPGGRVAIIEFDRRGWIQGLLRHYTPGEFIQREMEQAGYTLQRSFDFLDRQSFLVFTSSS